MAVGSVQGDTFDLKDLFGQARYNIEYYQREYAWTAEDVRILVTDLFEAFDRLERAGSAERSDTEVFFLGPFVYVEDSVQLRFLVDGQQRFTTLHLLFLHLNRAATGWEQHHVTRKLDRVITDFYRGDRPVFRLDIPERQEALEALYRDLPYEVPAGASLSVRNLHERSLQIAELLDERLESDRCSPFVDWLLSKVVMIGIRAPSRNTGFRIFESMNDRGTRLTPVDLVKSYLLSNVHRDEEKLNDQWRHMLAELTGVRGDSDAPRTFLKAALLARYACLGHEAPADRRDREEIDNALHIWVRKNTDRLKLRRPDDYFDFVQDLIRLATHHRTFLEATKRPYTDDGLSALYYNEVNGLTNQMAFILAAIHPHDTGTPAKEKAALVANFLDRLYVERVLNDEPVQAKDFQPDIDDLIPQLRECVTARDVAELLAAKLPTGTFDQVATFGMRGNNKAQVRYLLARLTSYVEKELKRPRLSDEYLDKERPWQIEHLYANHPTRHVPDDAPDEVTFRAWRARLGVLVLLRRSDNASYNDLPLEEKRHRYERENALAAILAPGYRMNNPTLKDFIARNDIGPYFRELGKEGMGGVVKVRGELYRRLCERIWDPQRLGFPAPATDRSLPDDPSGAETASVPTPRSPSPAPRRHALRTDLARMMRALVLPPGTELEGEHRGIRHIASVDADGFLVLPSGDHFNSADEAGKLVCGIRRCSGMAFWHVVVADGRRLSLRELRNEAQRDGRLAGARST